MYNSSYFKMLIPRIVTSPRIGKFAKLIPDKIYLKCAYQKYIGKKLNLKNPKTFNEKLQWLKLYDRRPEYTTMVDKYAVKKFIANKIGDQYIIPTLGVWNSVDDIDFESLPDQFVLKCTHDSGGLVICHDKSKLNIEKAKQKLKASLSKNFFYLGREWPYKNVKPRIIAEKLLVDSEAIDIKDYKLLCFNGKVYCSFVCTERSDSLKVTFFDNNWERMPFERHYPASKLPIPKPKLFNEMIELAEKLSAGIPFVRVDFYEVDEKIYFGELTFYPGCGFEEFSPDKWDYTLGKWIELPKRQ